MLYGQRLKKKPFPSSLSIEFEINTEVRPKEDEIFAREHYPIRNRKELSWPLTGKECFTVLSSTSKASDSKIDALLYINVL